MQGSVTRTGLHYRMYASSATARGTLGVQCWVRNNTSNFVLYSQSVSPRLMYVVFRFPSRSDSEKAQRAAAAITLAVIVAHAPTSVASLEDKSAFYDSLTRACHELRTKHGDKLRHILLGDFNAKIGPMNSFSCGSVGSEVETESGSMLRDFADEHSFKLLNTFRCDSSRTTTWADNNGGHHRLDYVISDAVTSESLSKLWVVDEIDLSTAVREDHTPVAACLSLPVAAARRPRKDSRPARWSERDLANPDSRHAFQCALEDTDWCARGDSPDQLLSCFSDTVQEHAEKFFPAGHRAPRKHWLTDRSWDLIKPVSQLRNNLRGLRRNLKTSLLSFCFKAWQCCNNIDAAPLFLYALQVKQLCIEEACALRRLELQQTLVRFAVKFDRKQMLLAVASSAQKAADSGNSRTLYAMVRKLAGYIPRPDRSVFLANGAIASSEQEIDERWQEHFAGLFGAEVCPDTSYAASLPTAPFPSESNFNPSVAEVVGALAALPARKATGPDGIPAELLRAGGPPVALALHGIISKTLQSRVVPVPWKGGKLINLWKGRADPRTCGHHRGLLLGDHSGKVFTSLLKSQLEDVYSKFLPDSQSGCVRGRGTSFVCHTSRAFLDHCQLKGLSAFVLFLDLTKAFDLVVREFVFGVRQGSESDIDEEIKALGLLPEDAKELARELSLHGSLLDQLGADPLVVQLVAALHTGSWFQFGSNVSVLLSRFGGRQGCKLGALIFNFVYARALKRLQTRMSDHGLLLMLPLPSCKAPWCSSTDPPSTSDAEVFDTTYVDDECIMLAATSPALLDQRIEKALSLLLAVFRSFKLVINWDVGKTECLLKYRGAGAHGAWTARCSDGTPSISVSDGVRLHINTQYKHTGSIVTTSGSCVPAARANASSTMNAWSKLAHKVFGSPKIQTALKLSLAQSLLFSRLFFATETWTRVSDGALKCLEVMHTRVVRRIAGLWNGEKLAAQDPDAPHTTDESVRRFLGAPSVQCCMQQGRLRYVSRLIRRAPNTLRALLCSSSPGKQSKWSALVVDDMCAMQIFLKPKLDELPDPREDAQPWVTLIAEFPWEWKELVSKYRYFSSTLITAHRPVPAFQCTGEAPPDSHPFPCSLCPAEATRVFSNTRALNSHQMKVHGLRREARFFVDTGLCPACGHDYITRARALEHVTRRRECSVAIHDHPRLSDERVAQLDASDAALARVARHQGHARPLATIAGPARGPKQPIGPSVQ